VARARERARILQVGHIERFNSAIQAVLPSIGHPLFIEVHRLAPFNLRGADVSVVMDLMIHDLDLLGLLVGSVPVDVRAKGAALLTAAPDIVNARLEYADGCVANVTASRVTASPMRKVRVFSDDGHCVFDARLMRRALEYVRAFGGVIAQHAQDPRLAGPEACCHEGAISGRLGEPEEPARLDDTCRIAHRLSAVCKDSDTDLEIRAVAVSVSFIRCPTYW
jgi:predicted dehydrogenase